MASNALLQVGGGEVMFDKAAGNMRSVTGTELNPLSFKIDYLKDWYGTDSESSVKPSATEQDVSDQYLYSADDGLNDFVIKSMYTDLDAGKYSLKPVTKNAGAAIKNLIGFNPTGYKTVIEQAAVKQIINEHGPNGTIDRSMADMSDITRMQYVIDHYDSIKSGGTTTVHSPGAARQANVVLFQKAVNGTNYIVEAVTDEKTKTMNVVSAYMSDTGAKADLANERSQGYNGSRNKATTTEGAGKNFVDNPFDDTDNLKANVKYQSGEFDYNYGTDSLGRLEVFQTDNLRLTKRTARLPHNPNTPGKLPSDHAGHLAGDRFGGSGDLDNLVSQSSQTNLRTYKKIENKWAKAIGEGKTVKVNVKIRYDGNNVRPSGFDIKYEIDGNMFTEYLEN